MRCFVCLISILWTLSLHASDKPLSEELSQEKKDIEETQTLSKEARQKAERVADKESLAIWNDVDPFYEAKAKCFSESEEIDIRVCLLKVQEKLANEGNFIAQDFLGKLYQNYYNNPVVALKWYKTAFDNPRTPAKYKYTILKELEALESSVKDVKSEDKQFSKELNEYIASLKKQKEMVDIEKRKAEILQDETSLSLFSTAEAVISSSTQCADKPNEHAVMICISESIKRLANAGNFYAQHQLGNMYETGYKNKKEAIKWYQAAMDNPKTPAAYKNEVEKDLKRAQDS